MLKTRTFFFVPAVTIVFSAMLFAQGSPKTAQDSSAGEPQLATIVERMQQAEAGISTQAPYQVTREYSLFSGNKAEPNSQVVAVVDVRPEEGEDYRIEQRSGSNRGEDVVKRILDHEVDESVHPAIAQASALTSDNYDFSYASETVLDGHPCYILQLTPKRKDKNLIAGQAWVDKSSYLVRHIEGELVKSPSWWLKQVKVKITFTDVRGAWTQSDVEALADVRIVGRQTLRSHAVDCQTLEVASAKAPARRARNRRQFNEIPAEIFFAPKSK